MKTNTYTGEYELVAILDGWHYVNDAPEDYPEGYWMYPESHLGPRQIKDMEYSNDWEWVMGVIDKIEELGYKVIMSSDQVEIYKGIELLIDADQQDTFLENASDAIGAFAVWYNKQQKDGKD